MFQLLGARSGWDAEAISSISFAGSRWHSAYYSLCFCQCLGVIGTNQNCDFDRASLTVGLRAWRAAPLGLRLASRQSASLAAWAWGVNGFFTVCADSDAGHDDRFPIDGSSGLHMLWSCAACCLSSPLGEVAAYASAARSTD